MMAVDLAVRCEWLAGRYRAMQVRPLAVQRQPNLTLIADAAEWSSRITMMLQ